MSQIRLLTEQDYEQSLRLSQYAFQYELTEEQKEIRKQRMDEEDIWGDFENGQLTAKLHVLPLHVVIHKQSFLMGGIAGVATWPEYRREGKVAELLKVALEEMRKKQQTISFLHPFQISFYRRFGWELFALYKKLTIEQKDLRFLPMAHGRMERVEKEALFQTIHPIYEEFSHRYNGMLQRTMRWWEQKILTKDTHAVVYVNQNNERRGYMLYQMKNRHMDVQEMVALDSEAKRALWNFICQHDSMADKVTIITAADDPLPYLLHNPRITQEIVPYFMARIVDMEKLLQQYPFKRIQEPLFFYIYDEYAPWNTGFYQLSNEGVKVFRKEQGKEACVHPPKRGLQLDINTAAALLLGYERPLAFYEMGKLGGRKEDVEKLEAILPYRTSFFMDFF
ncbi:GNAT family N-acetyltransferase [Thermaerobacillus caldiproteolyticus]|uniref:Putative acetyltransferase n=1 Tax=Thermaerobacillus caldiproteolyticus TaxID=247480 RepID=A0A7V9Z5E4_9BACL|nr:GNAT family N-acetyltransferase [Anoxybacillus caldiproteolyticus]MBA2874288.1 putative acetyltransferase [Anoxybacillus caldiproteolyticus]